MHLFLNFSTRFFSYFIPRLAEFFHRAISLIRKKLFYDRLALLFIIYIYICKKRIIVRYKNGFFFFFFLVEMLIISSHLVQQARYHRVKVFYNNRDRITTHIEEEDAFVYARDVHDDS